MPRSASPQPLPTQPMQQISRRARWIAWVPVVAALLLSIGVIALWTSPELRMASFAASLGLSDDVLSEEAVAFPAALLPTALRTIPLLVFAGTMAVLFQLFRRFSAGHVLDGANAKLVSWAGLGFVAFAATAVLSGTLATLVLTMNAVPGQHVLAIGFTASDIGAFAAGFALWGLGLVLGEAARVADEHASII